MAGDITTNEIPSNGKPVAASFTKAAIALSRFGPRSQRKLGKPGDWSAYSTEYARLSPRSLLAFDGRSGSGCVLRTASVSISRSSALVFGGSRV
jgi:hypothetical protein